jgi:hypothetical protein
MGGEREARFRLASQSILRLTVDLYLALKRVARILFFEIHA